MVDKLSKQDLILRNKEDEKAIKEAVIAASTSFATGMKILPKARRKAMFAVYVYCRELDDIADGDSSVGTDPVLIKKALNEWKERLDAIFNGDVKNPLDRSLLLAIGQYNLKKQDFIDIIDGCLMDADKEERRLNKPAHIQVMAPLEALNEQDLDLYCDRVASAVGRISMRVFGAPNGTGDQLAHHLGRALQIVNILRDIETDRELGRVYLPAELMTRFGLVAIKNQMLRGRELDDLCRVLASRAKDHFAAADREMKKFKTSVIRPCKFMAAPYRVILEALLRRGWFDPSAPIEKSKTRLALLLIRSMVGK